MTLLNEAVRTTATAFIGKREAIELGKDDHPQVRTGEADLLCSLQSVDPRHAEIEQDQVRLVDGRELNCVQAVTGSPDDLKTAGEFQVITQRTKRCGGIVGNKDANRIWSVHHLFRTRPESHSLMVEENRRQGNGGKCLVKSH